MVRSRNLGFTCFTLRCKFSNPSRTNEPEREKVYRVQASSAPFSEARVLEDELILARSSDGIENFEDERVVSCVLCCVPGCDPDWEIGTLEYEFECGREGPETPASDLRPPAAPCTPWWVPG